MGSSSASATQEYLSEFIRFPGSQLPPLRSVGAVLLGLRGLNELVCVKPTLSMLVVFLRVLLSRKGN